MNKYCQHCEANCLVDCQSVYLRHRKDIKKNQNKKTNKEEVIPMEQLGESTSKKFL